MAEGFDDNFVRGFGEVINQPDITKVRAIIDNLRAINEGRRFFIDEIMNLLSANLSDDNMFTAPDIGGEKVNWVAGGTYGSVYVGQTYFNAYKRMIINENNRIGTYYIENYCREIYLEAFIQYYLQTDPNYGHNICSIQKLYRDTSVIREIQRPGAWRPKGKKYIPLIDRPYIFYYRMEPIPEGTIGHYIDRSINVRTMPFTTIQPKLHELAIILEYFNKKCGFHHRDLHSGNVMFKKMGNEIKIIDFGMACITINGKVYSVMNENCYSYDLMIYTVGLYEYYERYLDKDTNNFLRGLFQLVDGPNILDLLKKNKEKNPKIAMFHLVYPSILTPYNEFWSVGGLYNLFKKKFNIFTPKKFAAIVNGEAKAEEAEAEEAEEAEKAEEAEEEAEEDQHCGLFCRTRKKPRMDAGKRRYPQYLQKYKKRKHTHKKHRTTRIRRRADG